MILVIFTCIALIAAIMGTILWFVAKDSEEDVAKIFRSVAIIGAIAFGFLLVISMMIAVVPAGSVGVQNTFGTVDKSVLEPGLHLKGPFTDIIAVNTRTMSYVEGGSDSLPVVALSNEGLSVTMDINILYHIVPATAPEIYKTLGTDYSHVIFPTFVRSVPRDIISKYDVKTIYSASADPASPDRAKIEQELYSGLVEKIAPYGITVESVAIRHIELPAALKDSITSKLTMEQEISKKEFEVAKERQEAARKVVEAQGISDANKIIANSLNEPYLKWYWLETMKSHQGTVYVVGGDNPFPFVKSIDSK